MTTTDDTGPATPTPSDPTDDPMAWRLDRGWIIVRDGSGEYWWQLPKPFHGTPPMSLTEDERGAWEACHAG